ncbi:GH3 family domain-containing protein [Azospirillum halopraeferens]|uniref:GH3 family domain-containing protein n=1 Tax=Azospirillum halopraeferens TaxID=34010 RepID=UPI0003F6C023|nr:GH3 auxin-responsive promoter family protein [Azospirillum halopraeferens]
MLDATPLLRLYARARLRRLADRRPAAVQEDQLLRLVRRAEATRFGRDHGFAGIRSVRDFRERVPLRRYEDFRRDYWSDGFPVLTDATWPGTIPYFAATSGTTTGTTKYIPVSRAMVRANTRAAFDLLVFHAANRPGSRVMGGRNFMLGGSTALVEEAPGIFSGDLSGIATREVPRWVRRYTFPPPDLALLSDWEQKVDRIGRRSLDEDIRTLGGTTSWLLLYLDRLADLFPDRPPTLAGFYPNLELLVHGGVSFEPYAARFTRWLEGGRAELREVYPASEGFLAVADRGQGEGLRLLLDNGLFFEFVPPEELDAPNPRRFWVHDAEPGVNYAVVLSTCAGAWSYVLGDTVRLVDRDPPRVLVTGRTSYTLSAFGEHLIGEEIERAVSDAAAAIGAAISDYSVGPVFPEAPGERGGHVFVVEWAGGVPPPPALDAFAQALDGRLAALNDDYAAHRAGGFGMAPPRLEPAAPGTFAAWMRSRGKLGGQNKVPRIINDRSLLGSLRRAAAQRRGDPVPGA